MGTISFNTDASYRDGWAGIAYDTNGMGSHRQLVPCCSSSEAELFALLLAMEVAEHARLARVVFRTDCEATSLPHRGDSPRLRSPRTRVAEYLHRNPGWRLELVPRRENTLANSLARNALKALSDVTVTVAVNTTVALALIERAAVPVTGDGLQRSASDDLLAALSAALVLLAAGSYHGATDRPRAIWRGEQPCSS